MVQVDASGYSLPYVKHQPHYILPNTLPRVQVDKHANPLMPFCLLAPLHLLNPCVHLCPLDPLCPLGPLCLCFCACSLVIAHHPIPNAKFPVITALYNRSTDHIGPKVPLHPVLKSDAHPKSMNKLTLNEAVNMKGKNYSTGTKKARV